jgi:hypothetical protein
VHLDGAFEGSSAVSVLAVPEKHILIMKAEVPHRDLSDFSINLLISMTTGPEEQALRIGRVHKQGPVEVCCWAVHTLLASLANAACTCKIPALLELKLSDLVMGVGDIRNSDLLPDSDLSCRNKADTGVFKEQGGIWIARVVDE